MLNKTREVQHSWDWIFLGFMLAVSGGVIWLTYQLPQKVLFGLIVVTMGGLTGYIYYAIRSTRGLTYEVERAGITINYGFKKILIPYQDILALEVKERAGLTRLAGNEWPGSYSGYFSERREKKLAIVYATELKNLIKIETSDFNYYISPQDNKRFMEKVKLYWNPPSGSDDRPPAVKRPHIWQTGGGILLIFLNLMALVAMAAYINHLAQTVDQMPMHYNFRGEVDRYGSPQELYFMLIGTIMGKTMIVPISDMLARRGIPPYEAARLLYIPLAITVFMGVVIMSMV